MQKLIMLALILCAGQVISAQDKEDKKAAKASQHQQEYEATKTLIESGAYTFTADWVSTQKGRRINIQGDNNTVSIASKNCVAYLPFFGTAHVGKIGGNGGFEVDGPVENYKVEYNDAKQRIKISFDADGKSERLGFVLSIGRKGGADLNVNSNIRDSNRYDGKVGPKL
ncbi:DUF4251 domain-containing protein [Sediminicola luteus]|uniref:DUF4251 domain-containing protein n=1 Tax=Sediminicola luteus TaxID=319238 RepID=A0A2A4G431_9FLAO|nr:DUF4251 domain-containing protein [Sediminicola luteus]PCE63709.1 hypothetical protein B7P33_10560 [Sediminicola luteus]